MRAGAHEDISVIAHLSGAEEGGLERLDRGGRRLPINPPPGTRADRPRDSMPYPVLANDYLRERLREIRLLH